MADFQQFYEAGIPYSLGLFYLLALGASIHLLTCVFRFAYFYFIKSGKLPIYAASGASIDRDAWWKANQIKWTLDIPIIGGWAIVLGMFIVASILAFLWPVSIFALIILGLPSGIIYLLAYRKRQKEMFVQTLKGDE